MQVTEQTVKVTLTTHPVEQTHLVDRVIITRMQMVRITMRMIMDLHTTIREQVVLGVLSILLQVILVSQVHVAKFFRIWIRNSLLQHDVNKRLSFY